jgi:predicted NAD-dependent protein-ADP-ribosyltransferase YbiA (DUF1768 family)
MVFSRLPGCETLAYPELAQLENADIHYTTDAYETEIKGITVTIAFGKVKREFDKPPYEAVYYPIYLVHKYNHSVIRKIGLIEYFTSDESHLDENLELNVVSAPFRPLIFPYITVDMLRKANMKSVEIVKQIGEEKAKKREKRMIDAADDSDTGKKGKGKNANANAETPKKITMMASNVGAVTAISDLRPVVRVDSVDDVDDSEESGSELALASEKNPGPNVDAVIRDVTLPTQTKALADKERAEYVHSEETGRGDVWIQQYMKNRHFGIEDNEGGTDSLFACIRDALLSQGNTTLTIEQIRVKLASMATKELFQDYIKHYNKYLALLKQASEQFQEKKKQGDELKERISGKHLSPADLLKVKTEMTRNAAEQREKKSRVDFLKDIVTNQYGYMRQTESKFDNFKTILTTRTFIPDAWALRALERAYNISIIRMSEERFKDGDLDNVIVCGDRAADAPGLGISMVATRYPMREWEYTAYKPSIFIVVSVDEHNTYRLIRYRTKGSFSFVELPYDIRTHIVTKCIEDPKTEFAFLPQFRRVLEIYPNSQSQSGGGGRHKTTDDDDDDGETVNRTRDVPVFQIYNRSGNDKPGHGPGEYVPSGMQHLFVPLAKYLNWRRSLTNMAESPFVLDRRTWFSVEHYYQGSKFKKHNHDFYLQFSMDSKSEISKNPELARAAGSDTGLFHGKLYRPKAVTIDRDFFSSGRGAEALSSAMEAKFRQHTDLRNILLGTLNARIYHFQRGERPILFKPLLQIRSKLESSV